MRAVLFSIGLISATSASAQMNTYRPGAPYAANPASSAQQCISTCAGDAACRGWNFVTLNKNASICEFNSQDVTPVSSPNAVSGSAPGLTPASSDRLIRTQGSATVRIGQPAPVKAAPVKTTRPAPPKAAPVISRQPVPQRRAPQPAAHTRRVAPAPARPQAPIQKMVPTPRQMFRHSLDGSNVIAPPQMMRRPAAPTPQAPPQPAPQVTPPAPRPVAAAPQPRAPQPAPAPRAPLPVANTAAAQDSLFGSLYDDVSIPAPANPRALADPDAPVATSIAVPVTPVTTQPLANMSDLAGGQPQAKPAE